jgi:CheY-like chemotaxis protein
MKRLQVLLDVRMPEKDGFTALTEIHRSYSPVPVLLCTAVNAYEDFM